MPETHDTPEIELWFGQRIRYRNGAALYAPLRLRIPSLFWHLQDYPDVGTRAPLTERSRSHEVDEPYRVGAGRAFRLWPARRAVVVGIWRHRESMPSELDALEEAIGGQMVSAEDMGRLGPISGWAEPDQGTDDSDVQPDTVFVYDDSPLRREGSVAPRTNEEQAALLGLIVAAPEQTEEEFRREREGNWTPTEYPPEHPDEH